jgi:hypothetical protein
MRCVLPRRPVLLLAATCGFLGLFAARRPPAHAQADDTMATAVCLSAVERAAVVDRVRGALWGIHIADALSMPGAHRSAPRTERPRHARALASALVSPGLATRARGSRARRAQCTGTTTRASCSATSGASPTTRRRKRSTRARSWPVRCACASGAAAQQAVRHAASACVSGSSWRSRCSRWADADAARRAPPPQCPTRAATGAAGRADASSAT